MEATEENTNNSTESEIHASKARTAALSILTDVERSQIFARASLNKSLDDFGLSNSDRAFTTKLVLGVAQMCNTLDEVIRGCVSKDTKIETNVMEALRISTYELLYLEKEAHAAVDQGVELVKIVQPKAKGLANLILHKIAKSAKEFPYGNPDTDFHAFCRIYAMPPWIAKMMIEEMGVESARYLIASSNGQAPCYLFINTLVDTFENTFQLLQDCGVEPEKIEGLCGVKLKNCVKIKNTIRLNDHKLKSAMHNGAFLIADSASQGVSEFSIMGEDEPRNILHVCAGKGNKTIMVSALANDRWGHQISITTVDNVPIKNTVLQMRCAKYGVEAPHVISGDAQNLDELLSKKFPDEPFKLYDNVLVDAPCSGLGTLRRHPEIKQRLTQDAIEELTQLQLAILLKAAAHVAPGGHLTYSTCTVTQAENQQVCRNFLATDIGKNFTLLKLNVEEEQRDFYRTQTVGGLNDTHFAAQFIRTKEANND